MNVSSIEVVPIVMELVLANRQDKVHMLVFPKYLHFSKQN
jgi:hypothetical protein